jgi:hypothetical protein
MKMTTTLPSLTAALLAFLASPALASPALVSPALANAGAGLQGYQSHLVAPVEASPAAVSVPELSAALLGGIGLLLLLCARRNR